MKRFHTITPGTILIAALVLAMLACSQSGSPAVIYVTATPPPGIPTVEQALVNPFLPTVTPRSPTETPRSPTPNPTRPPVNTTLTYTVKQGDSLPAIAIIYGVTVERILTLNPGLNGNAALVPGQTLFVPGTPSTLTPNFKLIPDSELVNSPSARGFDVAAFARQQPGFLRAYSELVFGRLLSGAQIVEMIALQNSVHPRLLLALLEYKAGWLSDPTPTANLLSFPMGDATEARRGLFRQLAWAADWLNDGYYGWKQRGLTALEFADKTRLAFSSELNAGSIAVQYFLSRNTERAVWTRQVSPAGFFATYVALFGDPFRSAIDPLVPPGLASPDLQFPFPKGETWYYTGGPHGGWGAASGWAGIDFAPPRPPDELVALQGACYISPFGATAMAAGKIVRSGDGAVVIDLDGDGDERTGWTLLYLHIADEGSVSVGTDVQVGSPIGKPSCQGFNLSAAATHLHIARRYNGEWIAADCWACPADVPAPAWVLSGWTVRGLPNQLFQGTFVRNGETRRAEQGRDMPENQVSW